MYHQQNYRMQPNQKQNQNQNQNQNQSNYNNYGHYNQPYGGNQNMYNNNAYNGHGGSPPQRNLPPNVLQGKQQHQQQQPKKPPPNVGYGIDDNINPYDSYHQQADSDDSSQGNQDKYSHDDNDMQHNGQVDIGSYRSAPQMENFDMARPGSMVQGGGGDEMLIPDIPEIPQMAQIPEVNMKPEEEELHRHVGFVIKLNVRLVQLNAEIREMYPKLTKDLQDSKISQFAQQEYKKLMEEKVALQQKCNEYEQQIQTLLPVQELNNDLQQEMDRLRSLTDTYSKKQQFDEQDYREMLSSQSRAYVSELQRQLNIYRDKVIYLSQQSQHCMHAIKNSIQLQKATQESITNSMNELEPLRKHLKWLEEQKQEESQATSHETQRLQQEIVQIRNSHKVEMEQFEITNNQLKEEIDILKASHSEKVAKEEQIEIHVEHKFKTQIQALEDRLSKMTVHRIQMEDDFASKQKQEQERADKYRAKYESVKQHVKTLEMQKAEYQRNNMQLRAQNKDFRERLTKLHEQLQAAQNAAQAQQGMNFHAQQASQMSGLSGNSGHPAMNQGFAGGIGGGADMGGMDPMKAQLLQLQQQQQMAFNQQRAFQQQQQNGFMGSQWNGAMDANGGMMGPQPQPQPQGGGVGGGMIANNNGGVNGLVNNNSNANNGMDAFYRDLWGKKTKTISEKGTKRKVLVEWHFITSDLQPHTIVLQHTQDTARGKEKKTRRMLWVDGSEKYNNKSSASSFRIEIDKDVVVVSIDHLDSYQYRLTINNQSYEDAYNYWEQNKGRFIE